MLAMVDFFEIYRENGYREYYRQIKQLEREGRLQGSEKSLRDVVSDLSIPWQHRAIAVAALGKCIGPEGSVTLRWALSNVEEGEEDLTCTCLVALQRRDGLRAEPEIRRALVAANQDVRAYALTALAELGQADLWTELLTQFEREVRSGGRALTFGLGATLRYLLTFADNHPGSVRTIAALIRDNWNSIGSSERVTIPAVLQPSGLDQTPSQDQ